MNICYISVIDQRDVGKTIYDGYCYQKEREKRHNKKKKTC